MINLTVRGEPCKLYWSFNVEEIHKEHIQGVREVTRCTLELPNGDKLSAGTIKNPKDRSDKETARKESLRRLIDILKLQIGLTKAESSFIRKHYYFRKPENVVTAFIHGRASEFSEVVEDFVVHEYTVGSNVQN